MFAHQLTPHLQELMELLGPVVPPQTYLAGGTALSIHLGHRASFDLDLYTPIPFIEQQLIQQWEQTVPKFSLTSSSWQTVIGTSSDAEVSIFLYEYPLLSPKVAFKSLQLASVKDIGCMKIEAIANRGMKRDFFDLYSICIQTEIPLSEVIALTIQKYNRQQSDLPHIFKSLVYFEDAEHLPERAQIVDEAWQEVKEYFTTQVPPIMKNYLAN